MSVPASIFQCPVCSQPVVFSHTDTTLFACSCGAVLHRKEGDILLSKPYFRVLQAGECIQPGTEGSFKGRPFKVLGRLRAWIEEFVWSYWTIAYADGTLGLLSEGYGLYAILEKVQLDRHLTPSDFELVKPGGTRELLGKTPFLLERKYTCYKWEVEGEAFWPESNPTFLVLEFAAAQGRRIEVVRTLQNVYTAYEVTYTNFSGLQLANLRQVTPDRKPTACPNCHKQVEIKAFPFTQSYACVHCGGWFVLKEGSVFAKQSHRNHTDVGPGLTLGAKGILQDTEYEVIGYMLKEERNQYRSQWKEYTLYNDQEGFAFLSEFEGHWIFVREQGDAPVLMSNKRIDEFTYQNEPLQLFNEYSFDTVNAIGSFPYNVFNDVHKQVKEYISPPEVWIQEKSQSEGIIWYLGTHISGTTLEKAFGNNIVLPYKTGVGAVEPKSYVSPDKLVRVAGIAVLLLILVHVVTSITKEERIVLSEQFTFADSVATHTYVSPVFRLGKGKSNLELDIFALVDNSWFELNATLVDVRKGTEYNVAKGVELYRGYSEGEYWSEGSTRSEAYLGSIPEGDYKLQLQGIRAQPSVYNLDSNPPKEYQVLVKYDVPSHRNFFICLVALVLWPIAQYLVVAHSEKKRWYNSPFSPYSYED